MKSSNKGFTLVEIMIVVAIIGILIAIAVPGFIKARKVSQGRACSENLSKLDGAVEQYALENNLSTGDTVTVSTDLLEADGAGYIKTDPTDCPSGGDIDDGQTVGTAPSCSKAGEDGNSENKLHVLPTNETVTP